jgi:hypothetical protein
LAENVFLHLAENVFLQRHRSSARGARHHRAHDPFEVATVDAD